MGEKVLALDYGRKRIGVATGDTELKVAIPKEVIENKGMDFVVEWVKDYAVENDIDVVVIGLPLNMEDKQEENQIMKDVKELFELLTKSLKNSRISLFDERLSSYEADQLISDMEEKGAKNDIGRDEE